MFFFFLIPSQNAIFVTGKIDKNTTVVAFYKYSKSLFLFFIYECIIAIINFKSIAPKINLIKSF